MSSLPKPLGQPPNLHGDNREIVDHADLILSRSVAFGAWPIAFLGKIVILIGRSAGLVRCLTSSPSL
ncbi:MAG: hypothetical protein HC795_12875 [Coleofasciculaceae cyanobacterium RL_1_1]|nr:hypothetical protein [Coleofasciculaceae cyanobacterium RL_1_1]